MEARQVKTITDAKEIVTSRELSHIKVGVFDIDGILRGKYMSREKFLSALDKGFGFCDVVLGWDIAMTSCTTTRNIPDGIPVIQMRQCVFCRSPVARFRLNRTPCFFSLNFPLLLKKSAHAAFCAASSTKPIPWGFLRMWVLSTSFLCLTKHANPFVKNTTII